MSRISVLAAILIMAVGLRADMVRAQDPEVGSTGSYRAEKTIADYMNKDQKSAEADFDYAKNTLRAEVWVDMPQNEIYRKGQDLNVGFQTNEDSYAVVYRIDTEGIVTVLWPRSRFDDGFVFGGHEYQLPVSGARKLRVSTQEGEGLVEALVSRYPFDLRALEVDFHHEHTADRYDFRVAGDPFLAMNEVNYAVTGLEDSGEYVVTNYASYYVHQEVDHPRYLCNQCHVEDEVAYDPYRDDCTLTIEYDYSWYNGWYDRYGYYPVYGNPVYVYIDPWTWSPWVNYWYWPSYSCAPWYGWGWGWGPTYSWHHSPYYWGDCGTAYAGGYTRYRPLDRTRYQSDGRVTKTREYSRGSEMVRKSGLSERERGAMSSRTRSENVRADRGTTVGRSGGRDVAYRGADAKTRTRSSFDQVATRGRGQGGLRIRETGSRDGKTPGRTATTAARKRHTAAGNGVRSGLAPAERGSQGPDSWRGTTRVGGASSGSNRSGSNTPTAVGNSRNSGVGSSGNRSGTVNTRSQTSSGGKSVQPRKRSTRVWNSTGGRSGTSQGTTGRSRGSSIDSRSRSGTSANRDRQSVSPRKGGDSGSKSRSSGTVKKSSGSRDSSTKKSSGSSVKSNRSSGGSRSSGSSSGSSRGGGSSRSSGSKSGSSSSRGGGGSSRR